MGQASDSQLTGWGLKPAKIRVLIERRQLLPDNLKSLLEKETGLTLEVQSFENEKSLTEMTNYFDIFIGSNCMMERVHMVSEDLHELKYVTQNISPDFITITQRQNSVIPLLWKFDKTTGFEIISLRIKKASNSQSMNLLDALLKKDFIQRWSETTDMGNTFMTLDEGSLEPELKASWLRTIPLLQLNQLHQTNCSPAGQPDPQK